jgi:hypothetical protein
MVPSEVHRPPFGFIVGSGRCGTTLLKVILAAGGDVAIPPESHFILVATAARTSLERADGSIDIDSFVRFIDEKHVLQRWNADADDVRRALVARDVGSFPDAVRGLYRWYADERGRSRYADKTPNYVVGVGTLADTFPEARVAHLIRDGRDVALSYLDVRFGTDRLYDGLLRWKQRVEKGRSAGRAIGHRYLEIRYEDLVTSTDAATRAVCDLLELPYSDDMLRYYESGAVNDHAGSSWHGNLSRPPTPGIRDWRSQLSKEQVAMCTLLAGPLLDDLGYEVPRSNGSVRRRAEAANVIASFQARRSAHAVRKRLPVFARRG